MCLTEAIQQLYKTHVQQPDEMEKKKAILESFKRKLDDAFRDQYMHRDVFLVGSSENGFALKGSDMDLAVILQDGAFVTRDAPTYYKRADENFREKSMRLLDRIRKETNKSFLETLGISWKTRRDANVPILMGEGYYSPFPFSVDLHIDNTISIRNTHLMKCYSKADDRVAPLVIAVKVWAKNKQIYKSPHALGNTLSGYSIALMVIHYLQCGVQPAVLPCLQNPNSKLFEEEVDLEWLRKVPNDLRSLLKGFFQYYSRFDFQTHAISVRTGGLLPVVSLRQSNPATWRFLCIEEPFTRSNTAMCVQSQDFFNFIVEKICETDRRLSEGYGFLSEDGCNIL